MPATHAIVDNVDGSNKASNGYVFPPCIIIERGESLSEWAKRETNRDFVTTLQARLSTPAGCVLLYVLSAGCEFIADVKSMTAPKCI